MDSPFGNFCRLIAGKHGRTKVISPEVVAQEWIAHSGLSALPSLSEIGRQMERYGLAVHAASIPDLRGHHFRYSSGRHTVLYEADEWRGAAEFTLLHEFYEIVMERLQELGNPARSPGRARMCWMANRFAAAVLMQKDIFLQALRESHFDIVWLHHHFYRSYAAVAIRALELLDEMDETARRELACVIYDRDVEGGSDDVGLAVLRVSFSRCTAVLRRSLTASPRLLPRRRECVAPGSVVELALAESRPVLVTRASWDRRGGEESLCLLARPVRWFGEPAGSRRAAATEAASPATAPATTAAATSARTSAG